MWTDVTGSPFACVLIDNASNPPFSDKSATSSFVTQRLFFTFVYLIIAICWQKARRATNIAIIQNVEK